MGLGRMSRSVHEAARWKCVCSRQQYSLVDEKKEQAAISIRSWLQPHAYCNEFICSNEV